MQHSWYILIRRMSLPLAFLASLTGIGATLSTPARADIYVYRDHAGVGHSTDTPTRPRYKIHPLFKSRRRSTAKDKYFKDSAAFDRLIVRACRRYNVEFALVKAVIKAESAFNPRALSSAGARGLMQLMPVTATRHGVTDIYSPRDNIEGGVRHLRYLLDHFHGNISLVLAAYNAGVGAVTEYKGIPPYVETQEYVQRVLRYRTVYRRRHAAILKQTFIR